MRTYLILIMPTYQNCCTCMYINSTHIIRSKPYLHAVDGLANRITDAEVVWIWIAGSNYSEKLHKRYDVSWVLRSNTNDIGQRVKQTLAFVDQNITNICMVNKFSEYMVTTMYLCINHHKSVSIWLLQRKTQGDSNDLSGLPKAVGTRLWGQPSWHPSGSTNQGKFNPDWWVGQGHPSEK